MLARVLRGVLAGYGATAVMDSSQRELIPAAFSWAEAAMEELRGGSPAQAEPDDGDASSSAGSTGNSADPGSPVDESQLSSPEKVAYRGAKMLGIELNREEAARWGNRVHWLYGIQWGVAYHLLAPRKGIRSGLLFGALLWLLSDELMLWVLRIARAPGEYPLRTHLMALAAHLVYGATAGALGRGLQR